jgi:hypothetical protein
MAAVAELDVAAGSGREGAGSGALLLRLVDAQRGRWALWLAPLLLCGTLLYFALPEEPPIWLGAAGLIAALVSSWTLRASGRSRPRIF